MAEHYADEDVTRTAALIVDIDSRERGYLPDAADHAIAETIARAVLDGGGDGIAARAKAKALREAADKWAWSDWANAPRRADRVQERIANAQHVADWLRARADEIEGKQ